MLGDDDEIWACAIRCLGQFNWRRGEAQQTGVLVGLIVGEQSLIHAHAPSLRYRIRVTFSRPLWRPNSWQVVRDAR